MTRARVIALLAVALPATAQAAVRDSIFAFVGANVVSMASATVSVNHTVIVRGGVIVSVRPAAQASVPQGATQIDARGKYLMPGLTDFHVHLRERGDLDLYLASGVTTLTHMGGSASSVLAWRDSIRAGRLAGPRIFAGYFVNGPTGQGGVTTVRTTDEARDGIAEAAERGFDFVKVYNSLTAEQYGVIMSESRRLGLPVLGHAVRSVGLERGFAMGQVAVVHAEEYMYADLRRRQDTSLLPGAAAFTRQHGAALIPNLVAFAAITRQWGKPAVIDSFLAEPQARLLSESWRTRWRDADYVTRTGTIDALPFLEKLTLAMQRGGVKLLLGTDSPPIPGVFPGASVHDEMHLLVKAGLTPYEALVAGTRNAGEFAARHFKAERAGLVAAGHRADLVLLARNPLEDVNNARVPLGVMTRGVWLTAAQLSARAERHGGR
jgi:imidazolonepropionase-like amidohydrolase